MAHWEGERPWAVWEALAASARLRRAVVSGLVRLTSGRPARQKAGELGRPRRVASSAYASWLADRRLATPPVVDKEGDHGLPPWRAGEARAATRGLGWRGFWSSPKRPGLQSTTTTSKRSYACLSSTLAGPKDQNDTHHQSDRNMRPPQPNQFLLGRKDNIPTLSPTTPGPSSSPRIRCPPPSPWPASPWPARRWRRPCLRQERKPSNVCAWKDQCQWEDPKTPLWVDRVDFPRKRPRWRTHCYPPARGARPRRRVGRESIVQESPPGRCEHPSNEERSPHPINLLINEAIDELTRWL